MIEQWSSNRRGFQRAPPSSREDSSAPAPAADECDPDSRAQRRSCRRKHGCDDGVQIRGDTYVVSRRRQVNQVQSVWKRGLELGARGESGAGVWCHDPAACLIALKGAAKLAVVPAAALDEERARSTGV